MRQVVERAVADLVPYARNARTHSPAQIDQIAASIREFGWTNPILVDGRGILAGHGRLLAAVKLGMASVPCLELAGLTDDQKRAYALADNRLALNAGWDAELLTLELSELKAIDFDLAVLGFSDTELNRLLAPASGLTAPDEIPPEPAVPVSVAGDVWICGRHRVMCGDSTDAAAVARLMDGKKAELLHADPPYGMGKEADGVANDNLYRDKLDQFQMDWWRTYRPHAVDNASIYIWGNAPDLWRLWYAGGLGTSENLYFCNHIVWDKKSIAGMASELLLQYPTATEHCLFFKIGDQFLGNVNADQYWEGWDEIRGYLADQASASGLTQKRSQEITGSQMYGHWFSKSQWAFISEKHYRELSAALPGFFGRPYAELRRQYEQIKGGYRNHVNGIQGGMRSYFDNAHDVMRDVWDFPRVTGDDRHDHATPKPVAMMERVMLSSLRHGGLCAEPFGGSGSTLMGAERSGRNCNAMEMQPVYCDVIVQRWQNFTGEKAVRESDGRTYDEARKQTEADVPANHKRQPARQAAQSKRAHSGGQPVRAAGLAD